MDAASAPTLRARPGFGSPVARTTAAATSDTAASAATPRRQVVRSTDEGYLLLGDDIAANAFSHAEVVHAADARVVALPELSLTGYVVCSWGCPLLRTHQ